MTKENRREQDEYFEDRAGTEDARYHVVPHDEEGWAVRREGDDQLSCTAKSQEEAIDEAKKLAEQSGTMVYIHGKDGKIEKQLEYGNE